MTENHCFPFPHIMVLRLILCNFMPFLKARSYEEVEEAQKSADERFTHCCLRTLGIKDGL